MLYTQGPLSLSILCKHTGCPHFTCRGLHTLGSYTQLHSLCALLGITLDVTPGTAERVPWHHTWCISLHNTGETVKHITSCLVPHLVHQFAPHLVHQFEQHKCKSCVYASWRVPWHHTCCITLHNAGANLGRTHHGAFLGTTIGASLEHMGSIF
jgi:hypothetical protein